MSLVPLIGGAYQARSPAANYQRCINLYPENNPKDDAPVPVTHYPTPGLSLFTTGNQGTLVGPVRGMWTVPSGQMYAVIGSKACAVDQFGAITVLGDIGYLPTPVGMGDNGIDLVITNGLAAGAPTVTTLTGDFITGDTAITVADATGFANGQPIYITLDSESQFQATITLVSGDTIDFTPGLSSNASSGNDVTIADQNPVGWIIDLSSNAFSPYLDPNFLGSTLVDFLDTFLLYSQPGTANFYCTLSNSTSINPLDLGALSGQSTLLQAVAVMREEVYLVGAQFGEVWDDVGSAPFTFQREQGASLMHGTVAPYSVTVSDLNLYWVGQDRQGHGVIFRCRNYFCERISDHGVEAQIQKYPTLADAISFNYQKDGHTFIVFHFPSGDATWVFDESTSHWHQWAWQDSNGQLHRHRSNCHTFAYGKHLVGDWQNGNIDELEFEAMTDNGVPIQRLRSWAALITGVDARTGQGIPPDGRRITVWRFVAYIEPGIDTVDIDQNNPPVLTLRWSGDQGKTWSNPITQSFGAMGQYLTQPQWNSLGQNRYWIFELSWSIQTNSILNGAFIDPEVMAS